MASQDPRNPIPEPADAWPGGEALDRALATSLAAPALPAGFRASLRRAIELENAQEALVRQRALEVDYARRVAELKADYVSLRRNTLATALGVAFAAGAGVVVVLPGLASAIGTDAATLAPLLAAVICVGIGAAVSVKRLGLARSR